MTINLNVPATHELKPKILVCGVGGAGCNAVNNMIASHLEGVEFVVANTDAQSLEQSLTERRIQLGAGITQGLGAGARPDIGRQAAEEAIDAIRDHLGNSNMVFIACGMGGGTGTGAAPIIAQCAREARILTIGVATKPFKFEGEHRMRIAEGGMEELHKAVDTMIVIPNQNLFRVADENTPLAEAFKMADDVLYSGVRGVTDLMVMPGLINLDFADVRSVMEEMGKAMMGTGDAEGEGRSLQAAEAAINNPLLDDVSLKGARGVLVNITGGPDMTLYEVDKACHHIREQVDPDANFIFGSTFDETLAGRIRVSVVATGIHDENEDPQEERASALAADYAAGAGPASWETESAAAAVETTFGLPPAPAPVRARAPEAREPDLPEPEPAAPAPAFPEPEPAREPLLDAARTAPPPVGRAADRIPSGGSAAPAAPQAPGAGTGTRSYSWSRLRRSIGAKADETADAPAPAEPERPAPRPKREQSARDETLEIPEFLRRL